MEYCTITFLFIVSVLILTFIWNIRVPKKMKLDGAHVLITGGSSGIGKEIAKLVISRGAKVTIMARNQQRLAEAKEEIEKCRRAGCTEAVVCVVADVAKDAQLVEKGVHEAESLNGPVHMLVNCAGFSISRTFDDLKPDDFKRQMDVNYLGTVYATKAVMPSMKTLGCGRIVFLSSQAGQIGMFGYTGYSPAKFALTGLAQALQMEVKPYNIYVTLSFPPDTETPGYAAELEGKPKETVLISETSGIFQPDVVAKTIIEDSLSGRFQSWVGSDGFMLACMTCGMSPVTSVVDAISQIGTASIFRLVSLFYLTHFDGIVSKCKKARDAEEKKTS
ncbi:3-ketodihydrosphingosine reductase-like [Mizuhopecten yessoensis]|uniref:3-dehydrosphinganine reductase n=1 Tax=Mizuhopecten yessoensis TaxID=6573 RepID=A0A210PE56_MIZYE|nr:3-ketodihydrosphingosine reductase-like [Mizuhopecten yessoensis]OWF34764.1 3-ketodihydrosphingosine reductase [Mizuhopecten yessoensis]